MKGFPETCDCAGFQHCGICNPYEESTKCYVDPMIGPGGAPTRATQTYPPDPFVGPGGAPTRATLLPEDPKLRKNFPVASGVLDYFPDALVAISEISKTGNDQHNPGLPLRWTRSKSGDEADTCIRHFLQRGTRDTDGMRHTAKAAWRMLALLQKEIESEQSERKLDKDDK